MGDAIQDYINTVYNNAHLNPLKKQLVDNGYECYITAEHVLLDDELWVHPDTIKAHIDGTRNPKYIFVFKDKFLNAWSSTQTKRKYKNLCKSHVQFLEKIEVL